MDSLHFKSAIRPRKGPKHQGARSRVQKWPQGVPSNKSCCFIPFYIASLGEGSTNVERDTKIDLRSTKNYFGQHQEQNSGIREKRVKGEGKVMARQCLPLRHYPLGSLNNAPATVLPVLRPPRVILNAMFSVMHSGSDLWIAGLVSDVLGSPGENVAKVGTILPLPCEPLSKGARSWGPGLSNVLLVHYVRYFQGPNMHPFH